MIKTEDFNYSLPQELIAQFPLDKRDHSRLMVVRRSEGDISHHHFHDLPKLLSKHDLVIMNDTKVIKARLFAKRKTGAQIEIFLIHPQDDQRWIVLLKPAKRVHEGEELDIGDGFSAIVEKKQQRPGQHLLRFICETSLDEALKTTE